MNIIIVFIGVLLDDPIKAVFHPLEGVAVKHNGNIVTAALDLLHDDQPNGPTILTYGPQNLPFCYNYINY